MFGDNGEMYGPGSNIGTREGSVQVSNLKANEFWYTETILSKNRDTTLYPTPSKYVVPLSKRYKNVLEVELLTAQFPISTYNIEAGESFTFENSKKEQIMGNNSFRFNEGYIIDNGNFYGICNDRLMIKEYNDMSMMNSPLCEQLCENSVVHFPLTLSRIAKVKVISYIDQCGEKRVQHVIITTDYNHNITLKHVPIVYVVDMIASPKEYVNVNGKYRVKEVVSSKSFIVVPANCQGPDLSTPPPEESETTQDSIHCKEKEGWLYIPRVESPHKLACMVQDYLNVCSVPKVRNAYSVTFDDQLGRFSFTRSYGVHMFDLLSGSDDRSILSATMGFSPSDYFYGQYNHLTQTQTRLPSEMLTEVIRPDILSESVGESALVSVPRGNYLAPRLASTLTEEMQRPLIVKCENDLLVVQIMGQVVDIIIPCGMYDPQNLIEAICDQMTDAYVYIGHINLECDNFKIFHGTYCLQTGAFLIESTNGEVFGLLFSQSTISYLLGFDKINLTGNCCYTSMKSVFFPITNRRFTDQIYKVTSPESDCTFRFIKSGSFQAPIVKVKSLCSSSKKSCRKNQTKKEMSYHNESSSLSTVSQSSSSSEHRAAEEIGVRVYTWTKKRGGCAHGMQCGDILSIEGQLDGEIQTVPPFLGIHVVQKVCDAYSFELALCLISNGKSKEETKEENKEEKEKEKHQHFSYVASHWFQPFSLFFSGVSDSIGDSIGFNESLSGCIDYVSPIQWNLARRNDVFLNIPQLCDTDNSRICKTSNSGKHSKYTYGTHNSFVRIPLTAARQEGIEFGLLSSSSYYRKKRFTMNSTDFYEVSVTLVDECGNLINFHGRDHSFDLRILIEQ